MERFEWDGSLALGISLLDEQHQAWIEQLNNLSAALEAKKEAEHITKAMSFIVGYSEFHFAAEEELMAAHNYPDLERHKLEHKKYRDAVAELMVSQIGRVDALRRISDSVNNFQISWLVRHIKVEDGKFAAFLDSNVSAEIPESL